MPDSDYRLDDRWAVVTGSTRGIGKAIALELAAAGANVVVHGRDRQAGEEVCAAIRQLKREAELAVTDVADADNRRQMAAKLWQRRPIDIWVNNAGVDVLTGDGAEQSFAEKFAQLWEVDVLGTIELARDIGGRMKERGHGAIINIGWDQAESGMEGDSGEMFVVTKGGIMNFTRSLAKSLAPAVRVNCIAPGWIRTAWGADASEYWQERAKSESLLARWGEVEDIAHMARFLASDAASFVNGQVIAVNGGRR